MNRSLLTWRSLWFHRRMHIAVLLGVVAGAASLTGALLVGDSMRGSLRETALRRLGPFDHALTGGRFVREALAEEIAADPEARGARVVPLIVLQAAVTNAETSARVGRVNVLGVDDRFWKSDGALPPPGAEFDGAAALVNEPLAAELGLGAGGDLLIHVEKPGDAPAETLLGRPEEAATTIRVTVRRVVPAEGLGCFGLRPQQAVPNNVLVPLSFLQRRLEQAGRINTLLVAQPSSAASAPSAGAAASTSRFASAGPANARVEVDADNLPESLRELREGLTANSGPTLNRLLKRHAMLADYGLRLRVDVGRGYVSLESERMLLEPPIEGAALRAAAVRTANVVAAPVISYLANSIERIYAASSAASSGAAASAPMEGATAARAIPYSAVAAFDIPDIRDSPVAGIRMRGTQVGNGNIHLSRWVMEDLGVRAGDKVRLRYFQSRHAGQVREASATFEVRSSPGYSKLGDDPGFTPEYKGITDATKMTDWDPPFPVDMKRIRDKDEEYWEKHRATPKAIVGLADGQRLWAEAQARFGRYTAIRLYPVNPRQSPAGADAPEPVSADEEDAKFILDTAQRYERILLHRLEPGGVGLAFEPVREQALAASAGSTDFSLLFIGFSMFVIAAAAMLVSLMFRLGVERRGGEIGILLATGWPARLVRNRLLAEGLLGSSVGAAIGLVGAGGYAWLMLAGLRTWWAAAVRAPFLRLHVEPLSLAIGFGVSVLIALFSMSRAVRRLAALSPRGLMAGDWSAMLDRRDRPGRTAARVAWIAADVAVASAVVPLMSDSVPAAAAFFLCGAAMLTAGLAAMLALLRRGGLLPIARPGRRSLWRLGVRNAARNSGRSVLTAGLIGSAAFVIIAVGANRHEADADPSRKSSGTGGHSLIAESTVPTPFDFNTAKGQAGLNLSDESIAALRGAAVHSLRLKPGDDSSCLNVYSIRKPRILGAAPGFIERGGFAFASFLAENDAERANPWLLLNRHFDDGAVPAIGDLNTVMWLMHLGLGKDLAVTDERGVERKLRFVALLSGSVLQGEVVIGEGNFVEMFPSVGGGGFWLIEAPAASSEALGKLLEADLAAIGFDAETTPHRLNAYLAVENTYLSTFQLLGGLGLALGALGLSAVMLRNVWERRGELALLRALGHRPRDIAAMVLTENAALCAAGLLIGGVSALAAVAPQVVSHPGNVPWGSLGGILLGVFVLGMVAGALAVRPALSGPLLTALQSDRG